MSCRAAQYIRILAVGYCLDSMVHLRKGLHAALVWKTFVCNPFSQLPLNKVQCSQVQLGTLIGST